MSTIEVLRSSSGSVRDLVSLDPDGEGFIDLSEDDWETAFVVLSQLEFLRIKLLKQEINVDFVDSVFIESRFSDLRSDGHFWGAGNRWTDCDFTRVVLFNANCPQNRFDRCTFHDVALTGTTAYESFYLTCRFTRLTLEGFSAPKSVKSGVPFANVSGPSVIFRDCVFLEPVFKLCRFDNVSFENCSVINPTIENCDFRAAGGEPKWWGEVEGDPFIGFIDDVLSAVHDKLGSASKSFQKLLQYREAYKSSATKNKDYSAVLYDGEVPESELDLIEDVLEGVERKSGWYKG